VEYLDQAAGRSVYSIAGKIAAAAAELRQRKRVEIRPQHKIGAVLVSTPLKGINTRSFAEGLHRAFSAACLSLLLDAAGEGGDDPAVSLQRALAGSDVVVVDAGSRYSTGSFKELAKRAGMALWVVQDTPDGLENVIKGWRHRPRMPCREVMALYGPGSPADISEGFVLPCVQVKGAADERGFYGLAEILSRTAGENGMRVLAVGFKSVPAVRGVVFDAFERPEEAAVWVTANVPDAAVISGRLKEQAVLLEYDLRKMGVPVYYGELDDCPFIAKK